MGVSIYNSTHDPFAALTAPPRDETPTEKVAREQREAEAKRISDKIDEDIKNERIALKKRRAAVRVLLLGQSESGKSTTLKNFRMRFARTAWKQERASWRAVIQLNLIRSVITIVELLQAEMDGDPIDDHEDYEDHTVTPVPLTNKHQLLKLRLGPLRRVEADLMQRLGAGSTEDAAADDVLPQATPVELRSQSSGVLRSRTRRTTELAVRGWKDALERPGLPKHKRVTHFAGGGGFDEATDVIAGCREDMKELWLDQAVRAVLKKRNRRLEHSAGFFLNDLDRIATRSYDPSDDDVVRARLRTVGVQEHKILFEHKDPNFLPVGPQSNSESGSEWTIYDVGGSRTCRHAWLPYFENVNAVIFLAPVSSFDERLLEDPSVNRLDDSFTLWTAICTSKFLSRTTMIVFLNKCDLLQRKLKSGVQVKKYVTSYADRPNDAASVVKYVREKFKDISLKHWSDSRNTYFYPTSVIDTKATANTLKTVRDGILREHLKNAAFV